MSDTPAARLPQASASGRIQAILDASRAFLGSAHRWFDGDFGDIPRFHREEKVFWTAYELASKIGRDSGSPCPEAAFNEVQDEETEAALTRLVGTFCRLMRAWGWYVWDDADLTTALVEQRRRRLLRLIDTYQVSKKEMAGRLNDFVCQARQQNRGSIESSARDIGDRGYALLSECEVRTRRGERIIDEPLAVDRPTSISQGELDPFAESLSLLARSMPQISGLKPVDQLTSCQSDCVETIREAKHRFTTTSLMEEMRRRGMHHGKSTTKNALAFLVDAKQLDNRQDVIPKGYGLPEWD